MTAAHLAAGVATGAAIWAFALAYYSEERSEPRAVYAVYGAICGCAALFFVALAWWL